MLQTRLSYECKIVSLFYKWVLECLNVKFKGEGRLYFKKRGSKVKEFESLNGGTLTFVAFYKTIVFLETFFPVIIIALDVKIHHAML